MDDSSVPSIPFIRFSRWFGVKPTPPQTSWLATDTIAVEQIIGTCCACSHGVELSYFPADLGCRQPEYALVRCIARKCNHRALLRRLTSHNETPLIPTPPRTYGHLLVSAAWTYHNQYQNMLVDLVEHWLELPLDRETVVELPSHQIILT